MSDAITRPLAALMAGLHPGWDIPGCAAAIHRSRHLAPLDQIAHAAIDLAMRPELTSPALLAEDGPHWRTGRTPDVRVPEARCPKHPHEFASSCRSCPVEEFEPTEVPTLAITPDQAARNARGAALVRAALHGETGRYPAASLHRDASTTPHVDHGMRAGNDRGDQDS